VLGLRLNVWTSIILFAGALVYFVVVGRRHPRPDSRETTVYLHPAGSGSPSDEANPTDAGSAADATAATSAATPVDTPGDTPG
jgi:hypothetical protein